MVAEHQIELRMLDNSHVYVTCSCILSAIRSLDRTRSVRVRRSGRLYGSLGDFPVGTPGPLLTAAFDLHLRDVAF